MDGLTIDGWMEGQKERQADGLMVFQWMDGVWMDECFVGWREGAKEKLLVV